MVDVVVGEIDPPAGDGDWKDAVRTRIMSTRRALSRHPWAPGLIETRKQASMVVLDYMDSLAGMLRAGGLSDDLTHHAMHVLGSRMWGFTQEVFPTDSATPGPDEMRAMMTRFPNIAAISVAAAHDPDSVVGGGCDDQFEFELAIGVLLDGIERLHERGWTSHDGRMSGG